MYSNVRRKIIMDTGIYTKYITCDNGRVFKIEFCRGCNYPVLRCMCSFRTERKEGVNNEMCEKKQ